MSLPNKFFNLKDCEDTFSEVVTELKSSLSRFNVEDHELCISEIEPHVAAAHLSVIDIDLFQRITDKELLSVSWTKPNKEIITPNICKVTSQFNNISYLTISEILKGESSRERAGIISHFIKILNELFALNNINSMKSIVGALECYPIFRLKNSFDLLNKKSRTNLQNHKILLSEDNNREKLRNHLDSTELPCVPFLGLYLTDLTYLDTVSSYSKDESEEERNKKMYEVIKHVHRFQKSNYNLKTDPRLIEFFSRQRYTDSMKKTIDETFYRRSLLTEPPLSPVIKMDNDAKANHRRSKKIKSDLTSYLRTYIPKTPNIESNNGTMKNLSVDRDEDHQESPPTFRVRIETTPAKSSPKKKPKYILKIEDSQNIHHEGYLKIRIQSFDGIVPSAPNKKKIWAVLTKECRLTHYLMNITRISCVFGYGQNSTFYVIDDVTNCSVKIGKKENEFIIISKNKACIHTYVAPSPEECKDWMFKLEEIIRNPPKEYLNHSLNLKDI